MSEPSKRKPPTPGNTDFESMTHAELAAMLESASSEGAYDLAAKLSKAASTITKIGDDLMTYVKALEWQGEAGDTFRDWGGQTAGATLRLGEYAETASRWMGTVSQAIAEAKAAMPDTSETTSAQADLRSAEKTLTSTREPGARNDPDARQLAQTAQSDATAAQGRIDSVRYEAAQQLRRLAQAYEYSAAQVNSVEPPTFSPPARNMDPDNWTGTNEKYVAVTPQSSGINSWVGTSTTTGGRDGTGGSASHSVTDGPGQGRASRSESADMDLDGLGTLPKASGPDLTTPPVGTGGSPRPDTSLPSQPAGIPPVFNGNGGNTGPTTPGRVSPATRPPLLPGQSTTNGSVRVPRDTGIVGGRPVPPSTGRPTGSLPRGTVIGEGAQGRAPMGRGPSPGMPGGGNVGLGHGGGTAGGRRLASEGGGVIGNRQSQLGHGSHRPFTPGGSGLVGRASASDPAHSAAQGRGGATPHTGNAGSPQRGQGQNNRPDYLSEDEETWQRGRRRPLPPVVD